MHAKMHVQMKWTRLAPGDAPEDHPVCGSGTVILGGVGSDLDHRLGCPAHHGTRTA
jgi:hypothetical protein